METSLGDAPRARQLNHVEMVYRPGERALAARFFELLGMGVIDKGGEWLFALVDPASADLANNACYASQVTAEQWALEQALAASLAAAADGPAQVGRAGRAYMERLRTEPPRSFHFGIRFRARDEFDAALERIRAAEQDPELAGRVGISGIYHPDDPVHYSDSLIQAFIRTDLVAAGLLAFGQHVELQWQLPAEQRGGRRTGA
jgi:hypothetical protein